MTTRPCPHRARPAFAVAALPLAALAAVSCAPPGPTLDQRLSTFVGRPEADLVAELGVPVRTYEAEDGRKFLQFESRRLVALPGDPYPFYGPYGHRRFGAFAAPPAYARVGCDITFGLRGGRVEGFRFRGEGCA